MKTLIYFLVLVLSQLMVQALDKHFAGGSMSFRFVDTSKTVYKLKLTLITGWRLGQGPCGPTCTIQDVGRSTNATRKIVTEQHGEQYFGNWSSEVKYAGNNVSYSHFTHFVKSTISGAVAAVNEPMEWEQEIAEVILDIDPASEYTDVSMLGSYWCEFYYRYSHDVHYHLQVKVHSQKRNDTGKPNRSPVAMFKPVYKIPLNSVTSIKLSTMDQDDDIVLCEIASFIEAGSLKGMPNTIINKDCSIVIKTYEADGFKEGAWGALALVVRDYNRYTISIEGVGVRQGGETHRSFSDVSIQFMIQTVRETGTPEFVNPTKESQHIFTVYVGSSLQIPLYAKPSNSTFTEIDSFYLRSIPRVVFTVPEPVTDPNREAENVKHTTVTWRPAKDEIGVYVVGALVTDKSGTDSNDRNYKVEVKPMNLTKSTVLATRGPFFTLIPLASKVKCLQNSTCSFPVYSSTRPSGGKIIAIRTTTSSLNGVNIGTPFMVSTDSDDFLTDVTIVADVPGRQSLCLQIEDDAGLKSEEECFEIEVTSPDPCDLAPCKRGRCISNGPVFTCVCQFGFTGEFCETDIDECMSKPCQNGATCYEVPSKERVYCMCANGFAGKWCQSALQSSTNIMDKTTIIGYNNGATFRCMVDQVCTIQLTVSKGTGSAPVLKVGPYSKGLGITYSDLSKTMSRMSRHNYLYYGEVKVFPTEMGEKKICIEAGGNSSTFDRSRESSVCYHLHVDNGTIWNDGFQAPTPPESSNIPCPIGEDCHIFLYTKPNENGSCTQVTTLSGSTANISPPILDVSGRDCITDVTVTLQAPSLLLCLESGKDIKARCLVIFSSPVVDPCETLSCHEGACIMERNGNVSCVCDDRGVDCSTEFEKEH